MYEKKKLVFLTDWAFVKFPEIDIALFLSLIGFINIFPDAAFTSIDSSSYQIALFGRVVNDCRANFVTGFFTDGHRIITSQIIDVRCGLAITRNTIYTLGLINENYKKWCENRSIDINEMQMIGDKNNESN